MRFRNRDLRARRWRRRCGSALLMLTCCAGADAAAQESRADAIAQQASEKAKQLAPYEPNRVEQFLDRLEVSAAGGVVPGWHPFLDSAYSGGGVVIGAGNLFFVSPNNTVDVRGSWTFKNYKRIEAEFRAPSLFDRRGTLSVLGGWREATQVGFWGFGTAETSHDDRANYSFRQPYASAAFDVWPWRRLLVIGGGLEWTRWEQRSGDGSRPSVEEVYTPDTLPGLGADPIYVHTRATIAFDSRPAAGYARKGGYYGVTVHNFADQEEAYSFRQVDYEAVQHVPVWRDAWVISLRGRVQTTDADPGDEIPFFMLPGLGGGSSLRGFNSWRFRDRHSLLLSAEWRVLVNRFFDVAVFYDAGKTVARRADLDLDGLKSDVGLGFRFHGPATTPLRIEIARSNELLKLVFSAKHAF